jgi:hypothetical protein
MGSCGSDRGVIGASNQRVIALTVHLKYGRVFGVDGISVDKREIC